MKSKQKRKVSVQNSQQLKSMVWSCLPTVPTLSHREAGLVPDTFSPRFWKHVPLNDAKKPTRNFLPVKLKLFESNTFHSSSPFPGLYVLAAWSIFSFNHSKWYGQAKVLLLGFFYITVLVTFCVFIIEIRNDLSSNKIIMKRALTGFQNMNVYYSFIPGCE